MSSQNNSQSINISGGSIDNAQVAIAGRDVKQTQKIAQNSDKEQDISSEEVYKLLSELIEILTQLNISEEQKVKIKNCLTVVRDETKEKEPDKELACRNFQKAGKIVKEAAEIASSSQVIFKTVEQIIEKLSSWFGVAAKTLLWF
jgi:hypothetical protein